MPGAGALLPPRRFLPVDLSLNPSGWVWLWPGRRAILPLPEESMWRGPLAWGVVCPGVWLRRGFRVIFPFFHEENNSRGRFRGLRGLVWGSSRDDLELEGMI